MEPKPLKTLLEPAIMVLLALVLCSTLTNQQLLEKHLEKYLLNTNAFQIFSGQCSHIKLLEEHLHL